jgi:hypothetical protein
LRESSWNNIVEGSTPTAGCIASVPYVRRADRRAMSKYVEEDADVKWVYGWDQPLLSFFLQKHDKHNRDSENPNPVIWLGATPGKMLYEVEDLVRKARKYGLDISIERQKELYRDRDEGL